MALETLRKLGAKGGHHVLDADIRDYFGSSDHDKLMKLVARRVAAERTSLLLPRVPRARSRHPIRAGREADRRKPPRAARDLKNLGFRDGEVRRVLAELGAKLDGSTAPVETILREALPLLT